MGQNKKQKKSAQPEQIYLSAAGTGVGSGAAIASQVFDLRNELSIGVIKLRREVLKKLEADDWVNLESFQVPFLVKTKYGVVGEIPERYEGTIRQKQLYSGFVLTKRMDPMGLRIILKDK